MIRPRDLPHIDTDGPEAWDIGYEMASKLWTERRIVDLDGVVLAALPGCREDDPGFLRVASEIVEGARAFYGSRLDGHDDNHDPDEGHQEERC